MEEIKDFLKQYQDKKFKVRVGVRSMGNNIDVMKKHHGFNQTVNFLTKEYNKGYGFKSLIKLYHLPVGYTKLKFLFDLLDIKRNYGQSVVTDKLRELRSKKAKMEFKTKTGFFAKGIQDNIKIRNKTSRGIQGYYYNKSQDKYVWLRSSWEYIYAKWLDSKKLIWDVEVKHFKLSNGYQYRPDFFIKKDSDDYNVIVEVKGYWKDKVWKYIEIKNEISDIDFSLVTNIKPFLLNGVSLKSEIEYWKVNRKNKLNIK
jgi:hypothetical protein